MIHAGKRYPKWEHADDVERFEGYPADMASLVGGIVGEAVVTDCVTSHSSEWWSGPFGFVMAEPIAYPKLIPYRGALGFFGVPESVIKGRS